MRKVLVLGGTGFIGRNFVETLASRQGVEITLANRGTDLERFPTLGRICVDREDFNSCRVAFEGQSWDNVFDFSGTNDRRVMHSITTIDAGHYSYLSSSAVDLALPGDPYVEMAKEKIWCEEKIKAGFPCLIVRAAFVLGKYDDTERFEQKYSNWVWKGTDVVVRPAIEVELLVQAIIGFGLSGFTGIVRTGYSAT